MHDIWSLAAYYLITRIVKAVRVLLFGGLVTVSGRDKPDGDTIKLWRLVIKVERVTVRVAEIDAPEKEQKHGPESRDALFKLIKPGTFVTLSSIQKDGYGRTVANVHSNGLSLNPFAVQKDLSEHMIASGHAWHYGKYSDNNKLTSLQAKAKKQKLGLWADKNPTNPEQWRRKNKK